MKLSKGIHRYDRRFGGRRLNFLLDYKPESANLILFIHGLACTRNSFSNMLTGRSFGASSLLLVDLIGFGDSGRPADFSYAMEDQAAIIEQLLLELAVPRLHIVAHSMGAAVGLLFSPELFQRVETFANLEGNLIDADCGMLSRKIAAASFEQYRTGLFLEQREKYAGDQLLEFDKTSPVAVYRSAVSLVKWSDGGELLRKFTGLTCRKGYFWGERNCDLPVLGRLESVPRYRISGSGHGLMVDNPTEFRRTLAGFIYGKPAGRGD